MNNIDGVLAKYGFEKKGDYAQCIKNGITFNIQTITSRNKKIREDQLKESDLILVYPIAEEYTYQVAIVCGAACTKTGFGGKVEQVLEHYMDSLFKQFTTQADILNHAKEVRNSLLATTLHDLSNLD